MITGITTKTKNRIKKGAKKAYPITVEFCRKACFFFIIVFLLFYQAATLNTLNKSLLQKRIGNNNR